MADTLLTASAEATARKVTNLNQGDPITVKVRELRELAVAYLDQLYDGLGAPETAWGWRFASMPEHVVIPADSEAEARRYAATYNALAVCRTVRAGQWHETTQ